MAFDSVVRQWADNPQMMLVGNKSDLNSKRQVSTEQAREFALRHGIPFIEVSALTPENIEEMFEQMVSGLSTPVTILTPVATGIYCSALIHALSKDMSMGVQASIQLELAGSFQSSKIDNMFGDLENVFACLGGCLKCCCSCRGSFLIKMFLLLPRLVIFCVLFAIFFGLVIIVVLPSMFWLLLVRARTVETESSKFEGSHCTPVAHLF